MRRRTGGADWFVKPEEHVTGRQQPAKGTTRTANGQDAGEEQQAIGGHGGGS